MGNVSLLSRLPVLRLLLPMVVGIVLYRITDTMIIPVVLMALALLVMLAMHFSGNSPSKMLQLRNYRIVPLALVMAVVGWMASWVAEPPRLDLKLLSGKIACGRVETIKYNEQSMLLQVKLLNAGGDNSQVRGSHILLSTRGCDYDIIAGNLIAFNLNLSKIRNMGNPDEMDYAGYLHDKGILYRQHTDVREVAIVGDSPTMLTRAFNFRSELQHRVLNSSLSPDSQGLIIAMLLGNDDFIEPSVRDSFSQAGIAHVLALSGLHVAVISFIIWFLLFPLDYVRGKKLRLLLTLLVLIAYDVLTGLSPSVIRSTVMIGFVFLSQVFYRKSVPLNSVAAAALVLLIFSPASLFSVGFQLSFITVSSLLLFYQMFDVRFPDNKFLKYLSTTLVSSAIAMISTLVLTAYYFNVVSLMAVLSNVLIMPLVPVFMVIGAVALVMLAMGSGVGWLSIVINWITGVIQSTAGSMSSLSISSGSVYVTWVAVVVYYAIVVMLCLWIYHRNARWLLGSGAALAVGVACGLLQDAMLPSRGMVILNSFNSTPVLYFDGNNAMLWVPDVENDFDVENFKRWNRAFLAHHGIDSLVLVDSVKRELPGAVIAPPYANILGTGIVAVGKGRWKKYSREDSCDICFNIALITKGYHSNIATLKSLVSCDSIILSGGIYNDDLDNLEKECSTLRIPHYNIKDQGAYVKMNQ